MYDNSTLNFLQLEAEKNKLENMLNNNLMKKKNQLQGQLEEITVEDRRQKLTDNSSELTELDTRINENKARFKGWYNR